MTDKKKSEVKEAVKALFSLMKSGITANKIMTRKVRYSKLCRQSLSFVCFVSRNLLSPRHGGLTMNYQYLCVVLIS